MSISKRLGHYLSLVKFSHTVFALPFAFIGLVLGLDKGIEMDFLTQNQPFRIVHPVVLVFIQVILSMVFARNAAMGFNRYLDADIDAKNERTANRDVPAGRISRRNALVFVIVNCLLFMLVTYFINTLCFYLAPIALFVILFYSYTKRFTALCHLVLGAGLSLAPIGAYIAVTGQFDILPLFFSAIVFTWVSGFDIMYALQDEEFDSAYKLHSIPVLLGRKRALWVSRIMHFITASLIISLVPYSTFCITYWLGAIIFIALLVYQHTLVKHNDISKINLAFGTTNGIASVVYASFVIADVWVWHNVMLP